MVRARFMMDGVSIGTSGDGQEDKDVKGFVRFDSHITPFYNEISYFPAVTGAMKT